MASVCAEYPECTRGQGYVVDSAAASPKLSSDLAAHSPVAQTNSQRMNGFAEMHPTASTATTLDMLIMGNGEHKMETDDPHSVINFSKKYAVI